MPKPLLEQATITEAAAAAGAETGRLPIQFISPGWGSSGYYSTEVIEEAAAGDFIPAGTHMYADHPTDAEALERPGRSIKDLMAVTCESARVATAEDVANWGADEGALVGEVDVVPAWRPLLETVRKHIGTSIRGSATDIVEGEAEGRSGKIIEGLVAPAMSVDFVTRAGRGGKVLQVLESADANRRALDRGVAEATVNDTREALQTVLREAYATGENAWVWVRDFDDTTVWFEVEGRGADDAGIYGQTYTNADGVVGLTGTRTEVRVQTKYVPVTRPDSTNPTTEESQEDTMGKIQIEEAEHTRLTETAGRVTALQEENATLKAERDQLREEKIAGARRDRAAVLIGESEYDFDGLQTRGLLADLPLKEGALDEEAFKTAVAEHGAKLAEAAGAGAIRGMGGRAPSSGGISWDDIDSIGKEG